MQGWIKLHRKLMNKAYYNKDSEKVHLWVHLLIKSNHKGKEEMFGGKPIFCNPGQFTTGRKQLSEETGIHESKIERTLNYFEKKERQIEQQKSSTNRLISIINWKEYQSIEQQSNNERTTSEQQSNTLQEGKKVNNEKKLEERQLIFKKEVESFIDKYDIKLLTNFYSCWSEPNKSKTKMRWEMQKTWDTKRRLVTWKNKKWNK